MLESENATLPKETPTQVFSCKYSEIPKNSFLYSILLASLYFTK